MCSHRVALVHASLHRQISTNKPRPEAVAHCYMSFRELKLNCKHKNVKLITNSACDCLKKGKKMLLCFRLEYMQTELTVRFSLHSDI